MRHLSDVFVVTPGGSLLAPNVVELQLNPDDLSSLCERMELGVISASMTEVYEEQVAAYGARFAGPGRADVYVTAGSVPPGRYRLRQGDPLSVGVQPDLPDVQYADAVPEFAYAAPQHAYPGPPSHVWHEIDPDLTVRSGMVTIMEPSLPPSLCCDWSRAPRWRKPGCPAPVPGVGRSSWCSPTCPRCPGSMRDLRSLTVAGGSRTRAGTGSPSTGPPWRVSSRSVMATRSAGGQGPTRRCPAWRSADARKCDNCLPRHGKTGWPRQWRAVVRELRRSGDGSAFPVVSGAR